MKKSFVAASDASLLECLSENVGGISLAALKTLIKAGEVRVSGVKAKENCSVQRGDEISVFIPQKFMPQTKLDIVFADENILVVNKPPYFDVENHLLTLASAEFPTSIAVHRLDRNTRGLVVFALNKGAEICLLDAFKTRKIEKFYLAKVEGDYKKFGIHTAYLLKDAEKSQVKISPVALAGYKKIVTEVLPLRSFTQGKDSKSTWVEVRLHTGRTHQIRAHLAALGHPVQGDSRYGSAKSGGAYGLVAYKLVFLRLASPLSYLENKVFVLKNENLID